MTTAKATPCTVGRQTNRLSRNTCDGRLETGVSRSAALSHLAETRLVSDSSRLSDRAQLEGRVDSQPTLLCAGNVSPKVLLD